MYFWLNSKLSHRVHHRSEKIDQVIDNQHHQQLIEQAAQLLPGKNEDGGKVAKNSDPRYNEPNNSFQEELENGENDEIIRRGERTDSTAVVSDIEPGEVDAAVVQLFTRSRHLNLKYWWFKCQHRC